MPSRPHSELERQALETLEQAASPRDGRENAAVRTDGSRNASAFLAIADGARRLGAPESVSREIVARGAAHVWSSSTVSGTLAEARNLARAVALGAGSRSEAPTADRRLAAVLARQAHFIATRCEAALAPAAASWPELTPTLSAFIAAEREREPQLDGILLAAGISSPGALPLLPAVAALMGAMAEAARSSPRSLAMILAAFEGFLERAAPAEAVAQRAGTLMNADYEQALRLGEALQAALAGAAADLERSVSQPARGGSRSSTRPI